MNIRAYKVYAIDQHKVRGKRLKWQLLTLSFSRLKDGDEAESFKLRNLYASCIGP